MSSQKKLTSKIRTVQSTANIIVWGKASSAIWRKKFRTQAWIKFILDSKASAVSKSEQSTAFFKAIKIILIQFQLNIKLSILQPIMMLSYRIYFFKLIICKFRSSWQGWLNLLSVLQLCYDVVFPLKFFGVVIFH